jgi:hypothetical protein
MTACEFLDERRQANPAWGRIALLVLLVGYLLFAHGCHGDEDNELLDNLPAIEAIAR